MFRRLTEPGLPNVPFWLDGCPAEGRAGDSVAAALLANGVVRFRRSTVTGEPRGPFCMMGACFDCMVMVDGVANRQACLLTLRAGMRVETGHGPREVT
jgi:hypothetical protein